MSSEVSSFRRIVVSPNILEDHWQKRKLSGTVSGYRGGFIPRGNDLMPKLSDNLRTTYTADGAVVLDIVRGRIFRFNPTGSRILRMLESGLEEGEIVSALIREFSADARTAESDTAEFLTILQDQRLVRTS